MGAEAIASVTVTDASGAVVTHAAAVKAVLESRELLLRTPLRRTLPVAALTEVQVTADGERLLLRLGDERFELALGAPTAARWAKKLLTPPPTLAAKLGLDPEHPPLVLGPVTDPTLAAALAPPAPSSTPDPDPTSRQVAPTAPEPAHSSTSRDPARSGGTARMAIAEVDDEAALLAGLAALPPGLPVWIVHRKGRVPFGDTEVRAAMRARGFIDTKIAAVSDARTATRYTPRPADTPEPRP